MPPQIFQSVSPYLDLLLFDIKHWDGDRHREGTGRSNRLPLETCSLPMCWQKVLPRLPVIPGYNDSLKDAAGFSSRLREAGHRRFSCPSISSGTEIRDAWTSLCLANTAALQEEDLQEFPGRPF